MTTQNKPQGDALREAMGKILEVPKDTMSDSKALREIVKIAREAPSQPTEPVQASGEREGWKDGDTAKLVNALRDVAMQFHDAEQLRERIAHVIRPLADRLSASPAAPEAAKPEHPTESVLIGGKAYTIPAEVAAELLDLHMKLLAKPEQQAQAGEPEVVAYRYEFNNSETEGEPLITLQSHREAMAKLGRVKDHYQDQWSEVCNENQGLLNAIAKKDAALLAGVEAIKHLAHNARASGAEMGLAFAVADDAIAQANEVLGIKEGGI